MLLSTATTSLFPASAFSAPELEGKPVVVLSNNDGCAVSMSNEAKALGIKRGSPYFRFRDLAEANGVVCLSGNHRLYGDMSRRVMLTLKAHVEDLEVYSIDEAFMALGKEIGEYDGFGRYLVRRVRRDTGIPVSIGIAPTKTLAKAAARFAKNIRDTRAPASSTAMRKDGRLSRLHG